MSKFQTITLGYDVGTKLLRAARAFKMPEKTGEKKTFTPDIRSKINKKIRRAFKALKKLSPIWMEDELLYFGPREGWTARARSEEDREKLAPGAGEQVDKKHYSAIDGRVEIEINLSKSEREGIYWLMYLMCHPGSEACLGAGQQDDYVWSVAEKLHYTKQLEEAIGINEDETIEVKTDDEFAEEEGEVEEETAEEPVKAGA